MIESGTRLIKIYQQFALSQKVKNVGNKNQD